MKIENCIKIPLTGGTTQTFMTRNGLILAAGYVRVVIGDRGPYVEFTRHMINHESLMIPEYEKWRVHSPNSYYIEYRSKDIGFVKVYFQKQTVAYADYIIGNYYISPKDLYVNGKCIFQPILIQ